MQGTRKRAPSESGRVWNLGGVPDPPLSPGLPLPPPCCSCCINAPFQVTARACRTASYPHSAHALLSARTALPKRDSTAEESVHAGVSLAAGF